MKRIIISTAFLLMFSGQNYIYACSCGNTPSPCQAYDGATAVFIGYVNKVEPEKLKEEDIIYTEQTAYVLVEKAFKGVDQGSELILHQPSHNCAPKFKAKQRYLLYAHYDSNEKTWEVLGCGRSTSTEYASDDLLYLQRLPESANETRISGKIIHFEDTPEKGFSLIKNIAGAKLKIIGTAKSYEVYTDQNGVYEVCGLPPGKYALEPEIPFGLKIRFPMAFGPVDYSDGKPVTVELKPKSCAGSDFILSSDTVISGKVFGANGEILPRVCLDLMPADGPSDRSFSVSDCTEKDGRYEMDEIPPGKYLIVITDFTQGVERGIECWCYGQHQPLTNPCC